MVDNLSQGKRNKFLLLMQRVDGGDKTTEGDLAMGKASEGNKGEKGGGSRKAAWLSRGGGFPSILYISLRRNWGSKVRSCSSVLMHGGKTSTERAGEKSI